MTKFRRKPIDVEAVRFNPDKKPWPQGITEHKEHWSEKNRDPNKARNFSFMTPGGAFRITPGDWVVTNQTGERYVVLAESFNAAYERVS
jgi:hypothetical protein